jgi:hypothetical protein
MIKLTMEREIAALYLGASGRDGKRALSVSATAAYVFRCGVRSRIFCAERVNVFPLLRRRRFERCGLAWGSGWRHFVVASKPRTGLGYRLALRRLCDRGLGKHAKQKQRNNSHVLFPHAMNEI